MFCFAEFLGNNEKRKVFCYNNPIRKKGGVFLNPFKPGTNQYQDFETMSNLEWCCSKCQLVSGQAKTWQVWRNEKGIQVDQDEKGNFYKIMECEKCGKRTYHRKLKSTEIKEESLKTRTAVPAKLAKRIKGYYGNVDEYSVRKEPSKNLEIDHRIPQVRWECNEDENDYEMPDNQLSEKFMLLTRANNLLKSRVCESCFKTGIRGKGYKEIEFWYFGNENYNNNIGCEGCFWHNPGKWRSELNKLIKKFPSMK